MAMNTAGMARADPWEDRPRRRAGTGAPKAAPLSGSVAGELAAAVSEGGAALVARFLTGMCISPRPGHGEMNTGREGCRICGQGEAPRGDAPGPDRAGLARFAGRAEPRAPRSAITPIL